MPNPSINLTNRALWHGYKVSMIFTIATIKLYTQATL